MNPLLLRDKLFPILGVGNAFVAVGLAWAWIDLDPASGKWSWRNVHWSVPDAKPADGLLLGLHGIPPSRTGDVTAYLETLEKPLFSPSRRPPPPKPVEAEAARNDPMADITIHGAFGNAEWGGVLARVEGRAKKIMLGEAVGTWTLKSVKGREATFASSEETRVLSVTASRPISTSLTTAVSNSVGSTSTPAAYVTPGGYSSVEEEVRARLAARNAIRARAGLPPLTK